MCRCPIANATCYQLVCVFFLLPSCLCGGVVWRPVVFVLWFPTHPPPAQGAHALAHKQVLQSDALAKHVHLSVNTPGQETSLLLGRNVSHCHKAPVDAQNAPAPLAPLAPVAPLAWSSQSLTAPRVRQTPVPHLHFRVVARRGQAGVKVRLTRLAFLFLL